MQSRCSRCEGDAGSCTDGSSAAGSFVPVPVGIVAEGSAVDREGDVVSQADVVEGSIAGSVGGIDGGKVAYW